MTKTIKIPANVHKELKVFVANNGEGITDHAGYAIMEYLQRNNHKFVSPKKQSKK